MRVLQQKHSGSRVNKTEEFGDPQDMVAQAESEALSEYSGNGEREHAGQDEECQKICLGVESG